jgi:transposase, IS5 family
MAGQPGFFDVEDRLKQLSAKGDALERLSAVVDFELFRADLERAVVRSDRSRGGRPPFDHVLMFKVLILQSSHNLSDERTQYLIRDRLSFMRFLGLGLADTVPDANTIWGFREALTRARVGGRPAIEVVFKRFEAALATAGFLAMSGQIIDASIVAAPKQRNTDDEKRDIKDGRIPPEWAKKPAKLRQKDRDARWTVKSTKAKPPHGAPRVDLAIPAFGYKNHIGIDRRHRLIRRWRVTDAARHDGALLAKLIDPNNTAGDVWADTAYRSQANEKFLAGRLLRSQIHRKKPKGKPCRAAPPGPMPANRQCVRRSSMSSPAKKSRWACSPAPSASLGREQRSVSPISSTTCSEWSGSPGGSCQPERQVPRSDKRRHQGGPRPHRQNHPISAP